MERERVRWTMKRVRSKEVTVCIKRETPGEGFPLLLVYEQNSPFLRFLKAGGVSPTAVGALGLSLRTHDPFEKGSIENFLLWCGANIVD